MGTSRKRATASTTGQSGASSGKSATYEQIAALAYFKAEARGFSPGHELDDWLEAEKEVNGSQASGHKH